jgi:hypothetical protein
VKEYRQRMSKLQQYVFMWPNFEHADTIGSKIQLYDHLDLISNSLRNTTRLPWRALQPGDNFPRDSVLKRSHSGSREHILFPDDERRTWEYMSNTEGPPNCQWIAQRYSHILSTYGQWRVFMIGGNIFIVIYTIYDDEKNIWTFQKVNSWYSLEELQ